MPIPAIEPVTDPDTGKPINLDDFPRDVGAWLRTLGVVLGMDGAKPGEFVRNLLEPDGKEDKEGADAFFDMLGSFDRLAKRCTAIGEAFAMASARLLMTADALAKETAPAGEYVGLRNGKRRKPASRAAADTPKAVLGESVRRARTDAGKGRRTQ
jgi:hypothetical protein